MNRLLPIAGAIALAFATQGANAQLSQFSNYTPLPGSASPIPVGAAAEATPITLSSPNFSQTTLADRATQNNVSPGSNSGNWDMIAANETGPDAGRYLFMPFETGSAGVQRIDLWDNNYLARAVTIVAPGTQNFVSGDASRWTPWGSYLTAEERWGTGSSNGRLFEVTNATTAVANGGNLVQRNVVPRVSHEGLAFDSQKALYFVDELNGGSVYKYVSANASAATGDAYFNKGQTFALKVGAGGQFEGNNGPAVTGAATWEAVTTTEGTANAATYSAMLNMGGGNFSLDGRAAADLVSATGFNRPEDLEIQKLPGHDELMYWATTDADIDGIASTGTSRVYNLNLVTGMVQLFADASVIDFATGSAVGGALRNVDNLAIDADGNIYLVEDRNGGVDDDIWITRDLNKDGDLLDVGEGIARWASNGTQGSEFSGLYFDKTDPNKAFVNIQHPASGVDRTMMITAAVPEPETYAMLLAGLGLIGTIVRRRRRRM
jgi:secreted PhoX family phosphatase